MLYGATSDIHCSMSATRHLLHLHFWHAFRGIWEVCRSFLGRSERDWCLTLRTKLRVNSSPVVKSRRWCPTTIAQAWDRCRRCVRWGLFELVAEPLCNSVNALNAINWKTAESKVVNRFSFEIWFVSNLFLTQKTNAFSCGWLFWR